MFKITLSWVGIRLGFDRSDIIVTEKYRVQVAVFLPHVPWSRLEICHYCDNTVCLRAGTVRLNSVGMMSMWSVDSILNKWFFCIKNLNGFVVVLDGLEFYVLCNRFIIFYSFYWCYLRCVLLQMGVSWYIYIYDCIRFNNNFKRHNL